MNLCFHPKTSAKSVYFWNSKVSVTIYSLEGCLPDSISLVERLYNIEHPKLVKEFDEIPEDEEGVGYWISKKWLKGKEGILP